MKKKLIALLGISTILSVQPIYVSAEASEPIPGVSVEKDDSSSTGYTVTFTYEDADASSVQLVGTFAFYDWGHRVATIPDEKIPLNNWEPEDFRASSSDFATTEEMKKIEGTDYWTVSLPLPSGHYLYNYNVDGSEENIPDPANEPMKSNAESGNASILSTVDVPYDEKQGDSINFDFMMADNEIPAGTIEYADYTDINGNQAPLSIYLPNKYDATSANSYKVLYLSHGGGGNEMEWFSSGNTNYVFDKLIADGAVEPTIVVAMSNGVYEWNYDVINQNLTDCIIPFIEEHYNVGKESCDRAFAGLSMGAMTTSNVIYKNADKFGYFGVFSGSDSSIDFSQLDVDTIKQATIMIGAGTYDMAYVNSSYNTPEDRTTIGLMDHFNELEIPYSFYEVKGGHDWTVWPQLLKIFAENYLWK